MDKRAVAISWFKTNISARFAPGSFARNVAVLAGGTALGQAITVLASPVLTRLYTPDDFGVLAVYSSILGILSVIASWRYELAIPLPEKDEDAVNLTILSLGIVLLMGLVIGFGIWLLGDEIVRWVNIPAVRSHFWLLPLGILLVGSYQVFNYWAVRSQAFNFIAITKMNQGLGATLAQIIGGFLKMGPVGLIIGQIIGQCAGLITFIWLILKLDRQKFRIISWRAAKVVAKRYQKFPLFSSFSGMINSAGLQIPAILLAVLYGTQVAGWFSLSQRILGIPMILIGQSVSLVYVSSASRLVYQDIKALRSLFLKTAARLLLVGGIPIGVLAIGGSRLFIQVFGNDWGNSGQYMQILCLSSLAQFVIVPLSQTINILERHEWQLRWDVFRLVLVSLSILLVFIFGGTDLQAIGAYGFSVVIAYGVMFMINLILLKNWVQLTSYRHHTLWKDLPHT